ncbi:uncharacterized protein CLAFUR5_09279 [Fulvia fulva]|uniref:Uncharacterized protein n=1 Tax=Passalora fulva TaxID=5499 RepID=A0A9Q8UTA6_PASFU|nr:uncharacterized protein CLAFUR5_09279 [Fulvia fulva]UJO21638.1 hypothetical protein CLAFUR5_09279 [Fulvia fulva]
MTLDIGRSRILANQDIGEDFTHVYSEKIPIWIRKAQTISIDILLYHPTRDDVLATEFPHFANLFYALIASLMTGDLKTLHIDLDHLIGTRINDEDDDLPDNQLPANVILTILHPLTFLPNTVFLSTSPLHPKTGSPIFPKRTHHNGLSIDLLEFTNLKDDIRRLNARVISTGVAPGGIRVLGRIMWDIENRHEARARVMPDYKYFGKRIGKVRQMIGTPAVRRLIERAEEVEVYWGEGCCCGEEL